jgi:uncharacterized protein YkwD
MLPQGSKIFHYSRLLFLTLLAFLYFTKADAQPPGHAEVTRNAIIQQIHVLVNQKRSIMSMTPLMLNDSLNKLAQVHSNAMAAGKVAFGHDGFASREKAVQKMFGFIGIMGENVTLAVDAEEAVESWWTSEGHQANMTGAYSHTGLGATLKDGYWYCTQIFINK